MSTVLLETSSHKIRQVHPRIWQITFYFPLPVNCWLWQSDDATLTLIDAAQPWNARTIYEATKLIKLPLKRIIITHAHPDHSGAAAELSRLCNADVFAHTTELAYLRGDACMSQASGRWICKRVLSAGKQLGMLNPAPVSNAIGVEDEELVSDLQVLHTPGHTPGSISLWSAKVNAIFVGDNISNSWNVLRFNDTVFTLDTKILNASLQRYLQLPVHLILPGHGPAFNGSDWSDRIHGFSTRMRNSI